MGIPTLISTATASDSSSVAITSGIDSTYDEYMFVFTDIGPATEDAIFQWQSSIDGGSNYNVTVTSTFFRFWHSEDGATKTDVDQAYETGSDLAQQTTYQGITEAVGMSNAADASLGGVLHLFSPASTTYVKHWYCRANMMVLTDNTYSVNAFSAGYFNDTNDIDAVSFKMSSGNFDGVIQMYGIAYL